MQTFPFEWIWEQLAKFAPLMFHEWGQLCIQMWVYMNRKKKMCLYPQINNLGMILNWTGYAFWILILFLSLILNWEQRRKDAILKWNEILLMTVMCGFNNIFTFPVWIIHKPYHAHKIWGISRKTGWFIFNLSILICICIYFMFRSFY